MIERSNQAAMDELVGKEFPVLDAGYVRLLDVMGSDATVVERARGTTGTKAGVDPKKDRDLIRLMMRKHHGSSFEFPEVDIEFRSTFVVWRQVIRHRAGNLFDDMTMWDEPSVNELSGRYSILEDRVQVTSDGEWRRQSTTNRQGSGDCFPVIEGADFSRWEGQATGVAADTYARLINEGVANEQARKVLPLGSYTTGAMKMDLRNWLHWLSLRLAPDAQAETRAYAQAVAGIIEPLFPVTYEAFRDYVLEAVTLSRLEILMIRRHLTRWPSPDPEYAPRDLFENKREKGECKAKMIRLGLTEG
jgi:thymidylate synthase (FAD)